MAYTRLVTAKCLFNDNIFSNETTATTFTTTGSYVTGEYGVYNKAFATSASTVTPEQMIFANNSCTNNATGFYLDFAKIYNTSQSLLAQSNTITATSTQYCNYGIYAQQSSSFGANRRRASGCNDYNCQ